MMKGDKVCLVVIYNHKFERNIGLIETIYGDRFDNILHVLPFCELDRPDVIGVYESSFRYQGYIAQAGHRLARENCGHYAFVADDLMLHPRLNAGNLLEELGLADAPDAAYIGAPIDALATSTWVPQYIVPALLNLIEHTRGYGVSFEGEIPSKAEMIALLQAAGTPHVPFPLGTLWGAMKRPWRSGRGLLRNLLLLGPALFLRHRYLWTHRHDLLPLPLLNGFSDFFVLPAPALPRFVHLCGVFAAMGIWVEMAIPTALALCCRKLHTIDLTRWQAGIMGIDHAAGFAKERDYQLTRLFDDRQQYQYLHPIKLSRWK